MGWMDAEWGSDGLPHWHGAQLAIDTTLVSPLHGDGKGHARSGQQQWSGTTCSSADKKNDLPRTLWLGGRSSFGGVGGGGWWTLVSGGIDLSQRFGEGTDSSGATHFSRKGPRSLPSSVEFSYWLAVWWKLLQSFCWRDDLSQAPERTFLRWTLFWKTSGLYDVLRFPWRDCDIQFQVTDFQQLHQKRTSWRCVRMTIHSRERGCGSVSFYTEELRAVRFVRWAKCGNFMKVSGMMSNGSRNMMFKTNKPSWMIDLDKLCGRRVGVSRSHQIHLSMQKIMFCDWISTVVSKIQFMRIRVAIIFIRFVCWFSVTCGQQAFDLRTRTICVCGRIYNKKNKFWLLGNGANTVPERHTWGGWWTYTVSLYINILGSCSTILDFYVECWKTLRMAKRFTVSFPNWVVWVVFLKTVLWQWYLVWGRRWFELVVWRRWDRDQKWKSHVLQRMADYDRVYYDTLTGASLSSKLCENAKQLEIKCMRQMNVYTLCEHGAVKVQGLTPIGTQWVIQ